MTKKTSKKLRDTTGLVTEIINALEDGVPPWTANWVSTMGGMRLPVRHDGSPYRGMNVLYLWEAAARKGYQANKWLGIRTANSLGGQVRRGEKGTSIIIFRPRPPTQDDNGETVNRPPVTRATYVWNLEQIDGLPPHMYEAPVKPTIEQQHADASAFFNCLDVQMVTAEAPWYSPGRDVVGMPPMDAFLSTEAYFTTLGHEVVHWTGHHKRLHRDQSGRMGSAEYAREELVAELGAAFLAARFGFTPAIRTDHAPYIQHWIKVLKEEPEYLTLAARRATSAYEYLENLQPDCKVEDPEDDE